MSRLFDELNHIDLLLEEDSEEVSVVSATSEQLTEGVLVLFSSIEGGREALHEAFGEFAISGVDHSLDSSVILLKVRSHQVWLGVPLPEALNLLAFLHKRGT